MRKNIYAQDLDFDFELNLTALHKIQNTITDHNKQQIFDTDSEDIDKNLLALLRTVNIVVPHVEIFYTPPGLCQPGVHVDGYEIDHNHAKLNWVFGATKSFMRWFQPKQNIDPIVTKTPIDTAYIGYNRSDCNLIWSHKIAQPTLVNAGIAHCIDNIADQGRWCVSHCLTDVKYLHSEGFSQSLKMLQWEDASERLRPWFKL